MPSGSGRGSKRADGSYSVYWKPVRRFATVVVAIVPGAKSMS
jgi:hypothetical protein